MTRARLAVALAATCALTAALGAPPASAAVTCSLAGTTATITVSAAGDAASIERSGNEIVVNSDNVAPTVTNTDRIVVNDTSGQGTRLRIDVGGGPFAPGASDEAGVSDEIEIQANMGDGFDSLVLIGSLLSDVWRLGKTDAGDGVNLNAGSETSGVVPGRDFDLEYFGVDGRPLAGAPRATPCSRTAGRSSPVRSRMRSTTRTSRGKTRSSGRTAPTSSSPGLAMMTSAVAPATIATSRPARRATTR